jgi:hypothetical protein
MIPHRKVFIGISALLFFGMCHTIHALGNGDSTGELYHYSSLTKQRSSSLFYNNIYVEKITASRFLPIFNLSGTGEWTSPRSSILIDGIPYNGYLLNLKSIDLVPLDIIVLESIDIEYHPVAGKYTSGPGGILALRLSYIPDTLSVHVRIFTGSETGDPLIYLFTRPELSHTNKNKIGPSFAASMSNRKGQFRYRVSGGGFFYFSTGSVNDFIFAAYDRELLSRQNRQVKISVDGSYELDGYRRISFMAAGLNLFSWEMVPFTSTFQHYTQIASTLRGTYRDDRRELSISLVRDESYIWMKDTYNTAGAGVRLTEYAFYPSLNILSSKLFTVDMHGSVTYADYGVPDSKDSDLYQRLLGRNDNALIWGLGIHMQKVTDTRLLPQIRIRYDKQYDYSGAFSGDASIQYTLFGKSTVSLFGGSVIYFPDALEKYGRFETARLTEDFNTYENFSIRGNPDLSPERSYNIGIQFAYKQLNGAIHVSGDLFYRRIENPIAQYPMRIVRSLYPGEIIRSAEYRNLTTRSFTGTVWTFACMPFPFLSIEADFRYLDNRQIRFLPAYKANGLLGIILPLDILFTMSMSYSDRIVYDDFTVSPEDDYFRFAGVQGSIAGTAAVDLSVGRKFTRFYYLKNMELRLEAQNIFNNPVRRIPIGNLIERALFVYLAFGL